MRMDDRQTSPLAGPAKRLTEVVARLVRIGWGREDPTATRCPYPLVGRSELIAQLRRQWHDSASSRLDLETGLLLRSDEQRPHRPVVPSDVLPTTGENFSLACPGVQRHEHGQVGDPVPRDGWPATRDPVRLLLQRPQFVEQLHGLGFGQVSVRLLVVDLDRGQLGHVLDHLTSLGVFERTAQTPQLDSQSPSPSPSVPSLAEVRIDDGIVDLVDGQLTHDVDEGIG